MFDIICNDCWGSLLEFFRQTFSDTSQEGLFKSLILLVVMVISAYGILTVLSYLSSIGANLTRKALMPVVLVTLGLFIVVMINQFRKDKPCKFSAERHFTQCTPTPKIEATSKPCPENTSFSAACKKAQSKEKSKEKSTWDTAPSSESSENTWDTVSPAPKSKTTPKTVATKSRPQTKTKSCSESEKEECDKTESEKRKQRDYSKE